MKSITTAFYIMIGDFIMHYFITSRIDKLTSAIELAEIKRLKLFKTLSVSAKIIALDYSRYQWQIWKKLDINNDVINPIAYFQELDMDKTNINTNELLENLLSDNRLTVKESQGFIKQKLRIQVTKYQGKIDYVTYIDRWGFTDRRDFYVNNQLSYSEYFDDRGKLITRTYYNSQGKVFLIYHYRGGAGNIPVLTLIQLNHLKKWYQFDQEAEFWAYFLDELIKNGSETVLYSDREDYVLQPFKLMNEPAKKFVILHSVFTKNAQSQGEIFPHIKQLFTLENKINGIICATRQEAVDLRKHPEIKIPCYSIPVSYLPEKLFLQPVPFIKRTPGQLIAIARLTPVKQLDQLITTVISIHQKLPFVDLKIYGYDDDWKNYETSTRLRQLVETAGAGKYIHFCGYQEDLTSVYQSADIEILTSAYEGFSMAILEALGHGCPVVSYNINYGPRELVKDNQTGKLVPAGDTWTLQRTLLHLLNNRNILKNYSQNAMKSMIPYSQNNVAQKWVNFITDINNN